MPKYHINKKTGRPNICSAEKRACPIGGEHFDSKESANQEIQAAAAEQNNTFVQLKKPSTRLAAPAARRVKKSREELFTTLMTANAANASPEQLESNITMDLRQYAEYERPGCGGCDGSGEDYSCRCGEFTGEINVHSEIMATDFYNRYSTDRSYKTIGELNEDEKDLVKELADVFEHHGISDMSGYEVETFRDYYGQELDQISVKLPEKFEELHYELKSIFNEED